MKQSRLMLFGAVLALAIPLVAQEVAEGTAKSSETASVAARPRKMSLNLPVLTVRNRLAGKQVGSCSFLPMTVSVSSDKSPLRISFSDDTPNGSGETLRNSLWMAALVAALQKESTLEGVRISLDFKGSVDGPSAGAVMCLGIMSALDGRIFPDDFAMTGTILPDGTVGLVGGVPEKLKAASKNLKIKRVAIPAFQRFAKDNDGEWVDLFALGNELGLELCPVESVGDAYSFLHKQNVVRAAAPSALSVIRESAAFEANVAEIFKKRFEALKELVSIASNTLLAVKQDVVFGVINIEEAENRFMEGAIFDAVELIDQYENDVINRVRSELCFHSYKEIFCLEEEDESERDRLRQTELENWPIEKQLAFLDGLRKLSSTDINWSGKSTELLKDEPWFGFEPEVGASDLDAQNASVLEGIKVKGVFRQIVANESDWADLEKELHEGSRTISNEISHEKIKLYLLERAKNRRKIFKGAPVPVMKAGREVSSALVLHRTAWSIVDSLIQSEIITPHAERNNLHRNNLMEWLSMIDADFSMYVETRQWIKSMLARYDDACAEDSAFGYPSYTESVLLFVCADLFVEASVQLLKLNGDMVNSSFAAYVVERARSSALLTMEACRKANIPCFASVLAFQRAERGLHSKQDTQLSVLSDYWKATMIGKALLMAFKNGTGENDGFKGYPIWEGSAKAIEYESAMLRALFNADIGSISKVLPGDLRDSLSRATEYGASKMDDEEWGCLLDVCAAAGSILIEKSELAAEIIAPKLSIKLEKEIGVDVAQAIVRNWGIRLRLIAKVADRDLLSNGRFEEVWTKAKAAEKNDCSCKDFQMPDIKATVISHKVVGVYINDWPGVFQKYSSPYRNLYLVDKNEVRSKYALPVIFVVHDILSSIVKLAGEPGETCLPRLISISAALKEAHTCSDTDSLEAVFLKIMALFDAGNASEGDDKSIQSESAAQDDDFDADYDLDD